MGLTQQSTDPTAGQNITQPWGNLVYQDIADIINHNRYADAADAATITFDLAQRGVHKVTLNGNRTLALSNVSEREIFAIILEQGGAGNRTVTWWSNIRWAYGGTVPTLSTAANDVDVFMFIRFGSEYMGFIVGQDI